MNRLRHAHAGEQAVVVFGGPSLLDTGFDLSSLQDRGLVVFLDTKALTPRLLESGLQPDYYLMLYPEKSKDNTLQNYIFRSFLAGVGIRSLLKRPFQPVFDHMRERFETYFEPWRPQKGPHKRFRWKPDVYLPGSPYDLLGQLPHARIIANESLLARHFPAFGDGARTHVFDLLPDAADFSLNDYYKVVERDDGVFLRTFKGLLNSAAIGLYPLLRYMGFREVYCVGMDMSMLGTMEYAVPYVFKSMWHFRWFFARSQRAFNANYVRNRPFYFRPQSEFDDVRALAAGTSLRIVRVYEPNRYAAPVTGIPTIPSGAFASL